MLAAAADRRLGEVTLHWADDAAVCVVMAAQGYPGAYPKGAVITGIPEAEKLGAAVFHAGTALNPAGQTVTAGGRVLGVTARGATIHDAVVKAYAAVACIHWDGAQYRRDIAARALNREA